MLGAGPERTDPAHAPERTCWPTSAGGPSRRDGYSPVPRRGSWSSAADEDSRRGGARGWNEYLPSYSEYEPGKKPNKRPERFSVRV